MSDDDGDNKLLSNESQVWMKAKNECLSLPVILMLLMLMM